MNQWSLRALKWMRNIIIIVGILGGLILWLGIPSTILNNRLVHVGNGKYGLKIGLLSLLVLPLLCFLEGISKWQDEIHTNDETERAKLEEEKKKAIISREICLAICLCIVEWGSMSAALLFC